ncbi:MAG: C-type lectin domain-containing protein [Polyangiaceae bacterium]
MLRPNRRLPWALACLVASSATLACSLLAPSDEDLFGAVSGAGGGSAGSNSVGAGGSGAASVSGDVYPVLPAGGSTSSAPPDDTAEPPPSSPPDAGDSEPEPCVGCESIRIARGAETIQLGTSGGGLFEDICPHDQVVVGVDYRFTFGTPADFGYFTSVSVVCGELVPSVSAGTVDVVLREPLPPRGAGAGSSGQGGRCPPGQVVTAFEGARNFDGTTSELREITLHCASLVLGADGSVTIGTPRPTQAMSADFALSTVLPDEVLPLQPCPDGQVARGVAVFAGAWVDGVSFVCGAPVLALPDGEACSSALQCQSGLCDETCQPRPCAAPAGCTCGLLETTQRAFCRSAQTQADAAAQCAASGMYLAWALDAVENGWLRSTAGSEGIQASFWLGADDLLSEGSWQWVQDGGAVDLASRLWDNNELHGSTSENCLSMTRLGTWDDVDCALALPFVCEGP